MDCYIELTQGQCTVVDEVDYEYLSVHKWCAQRDVSGDYYAVRRVGRHGAQITVRMHRQILGLSGTPLLLGDHIDGDTLNNRRNNLRIATNKQNQENTHAPVKSSTGVRGVSFHRGKDKYIASVRHDGRLIHLGYFHTLEEAGQAAQAGRAKYFTPVEPTLQ